MNDFCVDLKVCEQCGALFLRAAGQGQKVATMGSLELATKSTPRNANCHSCAVKLSEFPPPRERKRRGFECRQMRTVASAGGAR